LKTYKKINRVLTLTGMLILLFLAPVASIAQGFQAKATMNPKSILIGDQVDLSLEFTYPAGAMVAWPSLKDTILEKIQVVNRSRIDTTYSADKKTVHLTQSLKLTCFDSGFYTIPSIRFFYRQLPDTAIRFAQTEMQILNVHTVQVDTNQAIKPIKGIVKVPFSIFDYLGWIIAGLIMVALAAFLIWYYIKRKQGEPLFVLRPSVKYQPHEKALMDLEKLRLLKLWQAGKVKEYHSSLTDIVRTYLEDQFRLKAMESTTAEIIDDLREHTTILKENQDSLLKILSMADLVKFAKYQPVAEDHEQSMNIAVDFVNRTHTLPLPSTEKQAETGNVNDSPAPEKQNVSKGETVVKS
jgi:hypothetical protein